MRSGGCPGADSRGTDLIERGGQPRCRVGVRPPGCGAQVDELPLDVVVAALAGSHLLRRARWQDRAVGQHRHRPSRAAPQVRRVGRDVDVPGVPGEQHPAADEAGNGVGEGDDAAQSARGLSLEHAGQEPRLAVAGDRVVEHQARELQAVADGLEVGEHVGQHPVGHWHAEHARADEMLAGEQAVAARRGRVAGRVVVGDHPGSGRRVADRLDPVAARVEAAVVHVPPRMPPGAPPLAPRRRRRHLRHSSRRWAGHGSSSSTSTTARS